MNQRSDTYAFFAVFSYLGVVLVLMSTVAGELTFGSTWWVLLVLLALGIGFTGAAMRAGRVSTTTGIVAQPGENRARSSLTLPGTGVEQDTAPPVELSAEETVQEAPPAETAPAVDAEKRPPAVNEPELETPAERRAEAATGETVPDERVDEEVISTGDLAHSPPTNGQEAEAQEKVVATADAEPEAEVPVTPRRTTTKPDDLTKIEGIGPKMSQALIAGGVDTFEKLSTMSVDDIRGVLDNQGQRFAPAAESWAEQASYAAKGDWDGLDALQDTLIAGRYPTEE